MIISKNRVLKNASWIIACKIAQSVLNLIISMITARYLGPSNFGILSYASSLVAFIVPLVQLGLRNTLVQEVVEAPEDSGEIMGTALAMSTIASFFGIIGVIGFTMIVNRNETDTIIVCALYSISLIFQMLEMIQYWFQAKLLSKYTSITSLIAYVIVSLYKVYLLVSGKNIYWFAVSNALDYLLISFSLMILFRKQAKQKYAISWDRAKRLFSKSKYYIVSGMMVTVFANTDKVMIKLMIGDTAAGYYSAAMTCAGMASFVFYAIIDSYRPVIFESKKISQENFERNFVRLNSIVIYLGLLQSIVLCLGATLVIYILYGKTFAGAIPVLRIITWYSSFSYLGSIRNIWILAEGKQKVLWIINLIGASFNVFGNFALIPLLGICGAAIASVLTQFFTNFVLCCMMKLTRPVGILMIKALNPMEIKEMISMRRK